MKQATPIDDETCVRCATPLVLVAVENAGAPEGRTAYHLRCPEDACPADGGAVVTDADSRVTNQVGPVVDEGYYVPAGAVSIAGGPLDAIGTDQRTRLASDEESATNRGETHG